MMFGFSLSGGDVECRFFCDCKEKIIGRMM